MDKRASYLKDRLHQLKTDRIPFEYDWELLSKYIFRNKLSFHDTSVNHDNRGTSSRPKDVFDSIGSQAALLLSSTLHGLLNPISKWRIVPKSPALKDSPTISRFLENAATQILDVFNSPESGFQTHIHGILTHLVVYGTAGLYIEDNGKESPNPVYIKSCHISNLYCAEDKSGKVDTVFSVYHYTARQAAQAFGEDALSDYVKSLLESDPDERVEIIHAVFPASDKLKKGLSFETELPFVSVYFEEGTQHVISEAGYHENPYILGRMDLFPGSQYGSSPALRSLDEIRMASQIRESILRITHLQSAPPFLTVADSTLAPVSIKPLAINVGGLSAEGRQLIAPMRFDADTRSALEMLQQTQQSVLSAFYVDQLMSAQRTQIRSAEEVVQRREEQMRILGPQIGRIRLEIMTPIIQRIFGILLRRGDLGQVPRDLQGVELDIEYTGPLSSSYRAGEVQAWQNLLSMMAPLAQVAPELMMIPEWQTIFRDIAAIQGIPLKHLKGEDEIQAMQQQQAQQQAQMQQVAMMQQGVETAATAKKAGLLDE